MSEEVKGEERDEAGKVQKAEQPDPEQMIDPFVFKATGAAVNYDRRWAGTVKIGGTLGVWVTTPWNRGHGAATRELFDRLKAAGQIKWKENALYFTHEQGKKAAATYMHHVVSGAPYTIASGEQVVLKANAKSWRNRFEKMSGVKFEDLPQNQEKAKPAEEAPKEEVMEIQSEEIEDAGEEISLDALEGPSDEEVLSLDTSVGTTEEVVDTDTGDMPEAEGVTEDEEAAIAAVTATEDEMAEAKQGTALPELTTVEVEEDEYIIARVPAGTIVERISVKNEGVTWRDEDKKEHQAYFVFIPGLERDMWLEAGKHLIGNSDTGQIYAVNVIVESQEN